MTRVARVGGVSAGWGKAMSAVHVASVLRGDLAFVESLNVEATCHTVGPVIYAPYEAGDDPRERDGGVTPDDAHGTLHHGHSDRAAALAGCSGASPIEGALQDTNCREDDQFVHLEDDGASLFLDGAGEDGEGLQVPVLACYLSELDVPDSVIRRMEGTRALDGMQEATWDEFTARWSYHPDSGMDIIVEEAADG